MKQKEERQIYRLHNMCPVRFSFQDTFHCQSRGTSYQMINPWATSSHKRCSKQCLTWYPLQPNPSMLPSTTVTAAWSPSPQDPANQGSLHAQCTGAPLYSSALQLGVHIFSSRWGTTTMSPAIITCLRWTLNKLASPVHRRLCEVSLSAACRSHSQDCVPRGWLSPNTEQLSTSSGMHATDQYEVLWWLSVGTVPIIVWCLLPRISFHDCCYNSFIGRVHGWPAFKCAIDVTWRCCSNLRNTLARIIICMTSTWTM
jgi:hypothetical protein